MIQHPSYVRHIRNIREVPMTGSGDTLDARLRQVRLRGFPEVRIYEHAQFQLEELSPEDIPKLHTPQPHVHQDHLDRVRELAGHFSEEGIDIFNLTSAYDYIATDEAGNDVEWTILPPIIEQWVIPHTQAGNYDYTSLIGRPLTATMQSNGWAVNSAVSGYPASPMHGPYRLIIDGSHRVHAAALGGHRLVVLSISGMAPGYPYYAVPQPYSSIRVFPSRNQSKDLKIHIITEPGHKSIFRSFPTGGIKCGDVRPPQPGEQIA